MKKWGKDVWLPIVAVLVMLGLILFCITTAVPYKFDFYDLPIEQQRDMSDVYREGTKELSFYQEITSKSCPIYDSRTANLSMGFLPNFSGLLIDSNYVIYGTIQNIQCVRLDIDTKKNEKTYLVADSADALSGVDYFRYTVQIKKTLMGSFGWQRTIAVDIDGDGTHGPTATLQKGQEVVLFLVGDTNRCSSRWYEHGVFSVNDMGQVYAFSNQADNSFYDGKDVSILLQDIEKMKKKLGIRS